MTQPAPTSTGLRLSAGVTVLGLSLLAMLLFASLLVSLRLEKALTELLEERADLMAGQLVSALEGGLRFGVPLADQTEGPRKMAALSELDPELRGMALFNEQGEVVFRHSQAALRESPDLRTLQRLLQRKGMVGAKAPRRTWVDDSGVHVLVQVRDATGAVAGAVWAVVSAQAPQAALADSLRRLGLWAFGLAGLGTALCAGLLAAMGRRGLQALATDPAPWAANAPPWPFWPVPQALQSLSRLEQALDALDQSKAPASAPTDRQETRP